MSFHVEWDRLAWQAYDQIPKEHRQPVSEAIIRLMRDGIPDAAEPDESVDGAWQLRAGAYVLGFTVADLDIHLYEIESA
jgi:hypothetical protein